MNYIESLIKYSKMSKASAIDYAEKVLVDSGMIAYQFDYDDDYIESMTTKMCDELDSLNNRLQLLNKRDELRISIADLNPIQVYHLCENMTSNWEYYALITGYSVKELKKMVLGGKSVTFNIKSQTFDDAMDLTEEIECLSIEILRHSESIVVSIYKYDVPHRFESSINVGPIPMIKQSIDGSDIYDVLMEELSRYGDNAILISKPVVITDDNENNLGKVEYFKLTYEKALMLAHNFIETYSFGRNVK